MKWRNKHMYKHLFSLHFNHTYCILLKILCNFLSLSFMCVHMCTHTSFTYYMHFTFSYVHKHTHIVLNMHTLNKQLTANLIPRHMFSQYLLEETLLPLFLHHIRKRHSFFLCFSTVVISTIANTYNPTWCDSTFCYVSSLSSNPNMF